MTKCGGYSPYISDTGMRLSEAAGLALNDIVLDSKIPYINLKPNVSGRLKTKQSVRKIPPRVKP